MVTYDEALVIAKQHISAIDFCQEREDAFHFGKVGGVEDCVVYKSDGSAHTFHQYVMKHFKTGMPKIVAEYVI